MSSPEYESEFAALADLLRRETPSASAALRERVRALGAPEASRRRRSFRRPVLALVAAVVVAALGAAVVEGIVGGIASTNESATGRAGGAAAPNQIESKPLERSAAGEAQSGQDHAQALRGNARTPIGPNVHRAQDYRVSLRLRVRDRNDLSRKAKEALRLTRRFGGYVVTADYSVAREGGATLHVRIPIRRVQDALMRFSSLGTIVSQHVSIQDLQGQVDTYSRELRRLRHRAIEIRARLADPSTSAADRVRLQAEHARIRMSIAELSRARAAVLGLSRFATVSLALTTREQASAAAGGPGRIHRALDDAGSVLAQEFAIALYALIVVGPIALLAGLAVFGARVLRRRSDDKLLERA